MRPEKLLEVQVGSIYDVNGAAIRQEHVEHIHIMQLAIGIVDKSRNVSL